VTQADPARPQPTDLPTTLGALEASGWKSISVHEELRRNAAKRISGGQPVIEGVVGFDETVLPQLENALLAGHDLILLGERGQAKTRIARSLVDLLDEWLPVVAGSEVRDDPFAPVSRYAIDVVASEGSDTPIAWVHRSQRLAEKLATPDTSIADLIGEVDPIRVAEGRYLSDELTLHYGLVPRSNRGLFLMNELPDLAERIQVGLLNVLEERDVQIRGFLVRLPLDIMLIATANPEDYTNRGRIITPLKDRFGAQIRTHYPSTTERELAIVIQESDLPETQESGPVVEVPEFMGRIVAELSQLARQSPHLNQHSGVSVRLSITNYETMAANSVRRALRLGETEAVPRVSDLGSLVSSTQGKVEIEALEEGREEKILSGLIQAAVLSVFRSTVETENLASIVTAFDDKRVVHAGDDLPSSAYADMLEQLPELRAIAVALAGSETPGAVASAAELVLEGLHLTKRLNKDAAGSRAAYRGRS
jgi:magnesium chelatase subunit I